MKKLLVLVVLILVGAASWAQDFGTGQWAQDFGTGRWLHDFWPSEQKGINKATHERRRSFCKRCLSGFRGRRGLGDA